MKTIVSFWGPAYFQGRTVSFRESRSLLYICLLYIICTYIYISFFNLDDLCPSQQTPKEVEETNTSMKFDVDQGSITQVPKSTFETQLLVREFPNIFQSAKSTDTMATWAKIMSPNLPPMQKDIHDSLRACKAELEPSLESVSIVPPGRRNFGSAGPGFLLVHEKILGGSERM